MNDKGKQMNNNIDVQMDSDINTQQASEPLDSSNEKDKLQTENNLVQHDVNDEQDSKDNVKFKLSAENKRFRLKNKELTARLEQLECESSKEIDQLKTELKEAKENTERITREKFKESIENINILRATDVLVLEHDLPTAGGSDSPTYSDKALDYNAIKAWLSDDDNLKKIKINGKTDYTIEELSEMDPIEVHSAIVKYVKCNYPYLMRLENTREDHIGRIRPIRRKSYTHGIPAIQRKSSLSNSLSQLRYS